jgi:hypothetical protein
VFKKEKVTACRPHLTKFRDFRCTAIAIGEIVFQAAQYVIIQN